MTMTISTLFGVVLTALGQEPGAAGVAPDDAFKSNAPSPPAVAPRDGAAASPAMTSLFELSLPRRGQAR
jgi:hypothetical protein